VFLVKCFPSSTSGAKNITITEIGKKRKTSASAIEKGIIEVAVASKKRINPPVYSAKKSARVVESRDEIYMKIEITRKTAL
jgi:hypothetical protein